MFLRLRNWFLFKRFHSLHTKSRARIETWQLGRLQAMVAHAATRITLYRELYQSSGYDARVASLPDFSRAPVISKRAYRNRAVRDYTDHGTKLTGVWANSSGTTGEPITVLTRPNFSKPLYRKSLLYRTLCDERGWQPGDNRRIVRVLTKSKPRANELFIPMTEFLADPEGSVRRIVAFAPEALETYASLARIIAVEAERSHPGFSIRYVISGGEDLSPALRFHLEDALQCEVFNRYGVEEFAVVAMECSRHDGMHTNCESLYVEIVGESGEPLPDGAFGRVIVTDLYNTSMPFVRYDTGDHGRLDRGSCACGKESPRIWIEGRFSATLSFNGRTVHHLEFDLALDMFMHAIVQYQIVKHSESELAVVIIPGSMYDANTEQEILTRIQNLAGPDVLVRIERTDSIARNPRGKSQIVRDASRNGITE